METYESYEEYIAKNPTLFRDKIGKSRLRRLEPYLGNRRGEPPPEYQTPERDPIIKESDLNPIPIHDDSFLLKAMPPKASGKTKKRKKRKPRKKGKSHKKKKISRRGKK